MVTRIINIFCAIVAILFIITCVTAIIGSWAAIFIHANEEVWAFLAAILLAIGVGIPMAFIVRRGCQVLFG